MNQLRNIDRSANLQFKGIRGKLLSISGGEFNKNPSGVNNSLYRPAESDSWIISKIDGHGYCVCLNEYIKKSKVRFIIPVQLMRSCALLKMQHGQALLLKGCKNYSLNLMGGHYRIGCSNGIPGHK